MEPISVFLAKALGYILKGAAQSKAAETAKEELLGRFWRWLRPHFIKEIPEAEEKAGTSEVETKVQERLLELIKDEGFFNELAMRVAELQKAGIQEKNIVIGDVMRVKKIRIGDKEYSPNDNYMRKNVLEGDIEDADEFVLGDGHK